MDRVFMERRKIDPNCGKAFDTDLYERNPPNSKT